VRHHARELRRREGRRRDRDLREAAGGARAQLSYVAFLEIHLHFPEGHSLKEKRKQVVSLKEQLRKRFGASVAETAHHELWQRATLTAALVGGECSRVETAATGMERFVEARFPDTCRFERAIVSAAELLED